MMKINRFFMHKNVHQRSSALPLSFVDAVFTAIANVYALDLHWHIEVSTLPSRHKRTITLRKEALCILAMGEKVHIYRLRLRWGKGQQQWTRRSAAAATVAAVQWPLMRARHRAMGDQSVSQRQHHHHLKQKHLGRASQLTLLHQSSFSPFPFTGHQNDCLWEKDVCQIFS